MATVSIYLNFQGTTESVFLFYKSVFQTEFIGPIMRMADAPKQEGQPDLSDNDKNLVMHVALPLLGGVQLMGTDVPESMKMPVIQGNNVYINVEPDTRAEADRIFHALSEGGSVEMPLQDMFWGDYFGSLMDKFGVKWMVNCSEKKTL
jgi:PhnB protein